MEDIKYCIYKITNKLNGKSYIGFTSQNPLTRWAAHKKIASQQSLKPRRYYVHHAMRKYGIKNFTFVVIAKTIDYSLTLNQLETYFINKFDSLKPNGYNLKLGGGSPPTTAETKAKQSKKHSRYYRYKIQRPTGKTVETKNLADFARKNSLSYYSLKNAAKAGPDKVCCGGYRIIERKPIGAAPAAMGVSRPHSQVTKQKISRNVPRKVWYHYTITCPNGKIVKGDSLRAFARKLNLDYCSLKKCAREGWRHKGYRIDRVKAL